MIPNVQEQQRRKILSTSEFLEATKLLLGFVCVTFLGCGTGPSTRSKQLEIERRYSELVRKDYLIPSKNGRVLTPNKKQLYCKWDEHSGSGDFYPASARNSDFLQYIGNPGNCARRPSFPRRDSEDARKGIYDLEWAHQYLQVENQRECQQTIFDTSASSRLYVNPAALSGRPVQSAFYKYWDGSSYRRWEINFFTRTANNDWIAHAEGSIYAPKSQFFPERKIFLRGSCTRQLED